MQSAERSRTGKARKSSRHRLSAKLALSVAALLVGLIAAEILARGMAYLRNQETLHAALAELTEPSDSPTAGLVNIIRLHMNDRIMYALQPGLRNRTFRGSTVTTDEDGFRVVPGRRQPVADAITIVGLGDSVMFGHGIEDDETYLALLQDQLADEYPEVAWRVVNTAVPGYNTVMEVETLKTRCLELDPELVILHVVGNDYAPPHFVRRQDDVLEVGRSFLWEALWERVTGRVDLRHQSVYQRGEGWLRAAPDGGPQVPDAFRQLVGREGFINALDELIVLSQEHGFDLVVFTNNELGREPSMIKEVLARGMTHLSLTEDLRAWFRADGERTLDGETYHASPLVVGRENRHPSALQHQLAAGFLARWLAASGWIARHLDGAERRSQPAPGASAGR